VAGRQVRVDLCRAEIAKIDAKLEEIARYNEAIELARTCPVGLPPRPWFVRALPEIRP
jgi:hypothetical protein